MNNGQIDIVDIDERFRAVLYYDYNNNETPRDWGNDISVSPIKTNYRYTMPDAGVNDLGDEIEAYTHYWGEGGVEALEAAMLREKRAYKIVSLMSERDWVGDFVFYGDDETVELPWIEAHADTVQQFYNGEVYRVEVEEKQVYKNVNNSDAPLLERWEAVGYGIGGIYFDSGDSVEYRREEIAGYGRDILASV